MIPNVGASRPVFAIELAGVPVNLPNTITLGRIFLVPLLVVVLLTRLDGWDPFGVSADVFAAGIFALASVTDWLDGYLARRRKQVTDIGQWMDPLADKLLVTAALISLASRGLAPPWMVAVILGRELSVTVLRSLAHSRGVTLPASPLGKVKMVSQVVAILALILAPSPASWLFQVGTAALWVATLTALVSAIDYYRRFSA
jgi:CDP-diacylglycerol--glycerol-3-phosphate 3-phosphatidyltransferase